MPSSRDHRETIKALERKANDPSTPIGEKEAIHERVKLLRDKYDIPEPLLEKPTFEDIRIFGVQYDTPNPVTYIYIPGYWFNWDLDLEEDPVQNEWGEEFQ